MRYPHLHICVWSGPPEGMWCACWYHVAASACAFGTLTFSLSLILPPRLPLHACRKEIDDRLDMLSECVKQAKHVLKDLEPHK